MQDSILLQAKETQYSMTYVWYETGMNGCHAMLCYLLGSWLFAHGEAKCTVEATALYNVRAEKFCEL